MTLKEFLEKLEGLGLTWVPSDLEYGEDRTGDELRCANGDCPITAVYHALHPDKTRVTPSSALEVGEEVLGLKGKVAEEIVLAADDNEYDKYPDELPEFAVNLRARLEKACGIAA